MSKHCRKCGETKSLDDFGKDKSKSDGLRSICRPCASASAVRWKKENREKARETQNKFYRNNKSLYRSHEAKRRATMVSATFGCEKAIRSYYRAATALNALYGLNLEVDHIVPHKGENVCGLHAPWNLQLLNASRNRSKGNRFSNE